MAFTKPRNASVKPKLVRCPDRNYWRVRPDSLVGIPVVGQDGEVAFIQGGTEVVWVGDRVSP